MSVILHNLGFTWPDGTVVLSDLTGAFGAGRTGLVGANGSGKSTLLRLMAGLLPPGSGSVSVDGEVAYLPQTLTLEVGARVADLLGIAEQRAALAAIESGDADEVHFAVIGDDWDVEARARALLTDLGLGHLHLDRDVGSISGGEAMLVAIAGIRVARAAVTLLDEPTNNLDRDARAALTDLLAEWPGTLIVVSHDVALLDRMDHTAELHDGALTVFGGPYHQWRAQLEAEQAAAAQAARAAEQAVKLEKRQRVEAETKLARRNRTAKKNRDSLPPIVANMRASAAQVSAGKLRTGHEDRLRAARDAVAEAAARVRDDEHIRVELPDPRLPAGRTIAEVDGADGVPGCGGAAAGRARRTQRGRQDDVAARPAGRRRAADRAGRVFAAASRRPRRRRHRARHDARGRPGCVGGDTARPIGAVPAARRQRAPPCGQPLRRGAVSGGAGPVVARRAARGAAGPRRADQQPRPDQRRTTRRRVGQLPRRPAGGQPR